MRALELHASAKIIQRSKGRSSVAAAAYRAGERLYDERTGLTHDYTYKNDVDFTRIYLPDNASSEYRDRATLWNAVEKKENRSNSCTARELEIAFPYEFNVMQRREAGDAVARELMGRYGCAVDIAYHQPSKSGDQRNYHSHILFTDRAFDQSAKDGWAKNKYRDLSNDKITVDGKATSRGQQEVLSLREFTAGVMNTIAERDDLSVKVEYLSFEARGIDREPQIHLGTAANDMERKGNSTDRGKQNKSIIDFNKKKEEIKKGKSFERFDEHAGSKQAQLQLWMLDEKIAEDRRCESEKRKLEKKLDEFYGVHEKKWKKQLKEFKAKADENGLIRAVKILSGENRKNIEKALALKKSLEHSKMLKNQERSKLAGIQKERRRNIEKRHEQAELKLESEILKARSSFEEEESKGKGEASGHVAPKRVQKNTARKRRTASYSSKGMAEARKSRIKNTQKDSVAVKGKSSKKRGRTKPEHDYVPPKGPDLGR